MELKLYFKIVFNPKCLFQKKKDQGLMSKVSVTENRQRNSRENDRAKETKARTKIVNFSNS